MRSQEKELKKLQSEVAHQKALNDDYRAKIEELVKKGGANLLNQQSNQNSYQQQNQSAHSIPNSKA